MKIEEYKLPYRISKETEDYEEDLEKEGKVIKIYKLKEEYNEKENFKIKAPRQQKVSVPILQRMIKDMQVEGPQPLEKIGSEVVGSLFDRLKFLKERIMEVQKAIKEREEMNKRFNEEIDHDIAEMEKILTTISDREQLREFKLNLTLLRMEKRKENTIFWRDMVSLRKQLKELVEEYETESKISNLFSRFNFGEQEWKK